MKINLVFIEKKLELSVYYILSVNFNNSVAKRLTVTLYCIYWSIPTGDQ